MVALDPISMWLRLLRDEEPGDACASLARVMEQRHLTFGRRLLCPFVRPFFLSASDEARVKPAAEALWRLGERLAQAASADPALMDALVLNDAERELVSIDPGAGPASTAARADAFLLPESLHFAEYNGESPAGAGYSQRLCEVFDARATMAQFKSAFDVRYDTPIAHLLDALLQTYREWGGTARPPHIAIVDWRTVPTWSEFELLAAAFSAAGVPTTVHAPEELTLETDGLFAGPQRIDLVYRRVLVNDIVARQEECRALVDAYRRGAVCVANTLRCKLAHKKAFFAVLTDDRFEHLFDETDLAAIRQHVPWTRLVRHEATTRDGRRVDLAEYLRDNREGFVLKPNDEYGGSGVTLGWETDTRGWDAAIERALAEADRGWIAQERIPIRRELFPVCEADRLVERQMLVDLAPYVFRGRVAGFLTRLSATGLANVTSGGGQVPAFVINPKAARNAD
jgi:uncharacterized circularly permuted ATP-grasp superfamily protein